MSDPSADQLPLELEVEEETRIQDSEEWPLDRAAISLLLRAALSRSDLKAQALADWLNAGPGAELLTPAVVNAQIAGARAAVALLLVRL